MDSRLKLNIQQRQQQTLTPMQIQFVRVLEMSGPEVEDEVREVLDENPALEVVADDVCQDGEEHFGESAEEMQLADYRSEDDVPLSRADMSYHRGERAFEPVLAERGDTLMESIMRQLGESGMPADEMAIAKYIAGNIDDNGYLERSIAAIVDDVAIDTGRDVSADDVRRVWQHIRALEPAGIGAIDLRDCLLLQLRRRRQSGDNSPEADVAQTVVEHYFDLFSKMHFERLRSAVGADAATFAGAMELIKGLNPKPGALVTGGADDDRTRQITPDFIVETDPVSGEISLSLPNNLPQLQIERTFAADSQLPSGRGGDAAALFIKQKREEAATFIKVLAMRQQTLFNVMSAIVMLQREFFLTDDIKSLRPMILKDVAAVTGYDLSVISRATAGKYVATQRGVYPLRFFFSERPNENVEASAHEILDAIRQLVENEDKRSPLSDSEIAERLNESGYGIARRTVAKYRDKLGLPVGRLRRKL